MHQYLASTQGYATNDWGNPFFWVVLMVLLAGLLLIGFLFVRFGNFGQKPTPPERPDTSDVGSHQAS